MQIQNTLRHYKRDINIMWFNQYGLRLHRNFQSFYYYTVQQNEGLQPATHPLHFLFTLSQSLSHNHKDQFYNATIQYIAVLQCYNTIHSHITMLSFYMGITMGKYHGSPNTMGMQTIRQYSSR